ncbi:MAG: MBL fold metallo-hydrolase [Alphaproteobacteria bacterium]
MTCFQKPKKWFKNLAEYFNVSADPKGQTAEFIILGSGGSTGVPAIGNIWGKCDPNNPKNLRSRTSALIKYNGMNFIIDTGPDFKHQANAHNLTKIDGVIYTHDHGDHTNGIDELRVYKNRQGHNIPVYGTDETLGSIESRHGHMFESRSEFYSQVVDKNILTAKDMKQKFEIASGLYITPFEMQHGHIMSTGYRIGDLAYCVDMSYIPDESIEALKGIKTLILDSAGYQFPESRQHANLEYIKELQKQIQPEQTVLTVLSVIMDYEDVKAHAPQGAIPAYDGFKTIITL